jgi:hypothetical protein
MTFTLKKDRGITLCIEIRQAGVSYLVKDEYEDSETRFSLFDYKSAKEMYCYLSNSI